MTDNWINEFEAEADRRVEAGERAVETARQRAVDHRVYVEKRGAVRETERNFSTALNAKYFDEALKQVLREIIRKRVIDARRASKDCLRDYTDEQVEQLLRRRDEQDREMELHAHVSGPELRGEDVVQVVRIELQAQTHVFYICPHSGRVM